MEFKHFSPKEMETLDQYAIACVLALISLDSLATFQEVGLNLGVLKEDEECRLNTIIWDIRRLRRLFYEQAASALERVPDMNIDSIIESLKAKELPSRKKKNGIQRTVQA